eukprot:1303624-Amphidinium_carterae.1
MHNWACVAMTPLHESNGKALSWFWACLDKLLMFDAESSKAGYWRNSLNPIHYKVFKIPFIDNENGWFWLSKLYMSNTTHKDGSSPSEPIQVDSMLLHAEILHGYCS